MYILLKYAILHNELLLVLSVCFDANTFSLLLKNEMKDFNFYFSTRSVYFSKLWL